MAKHPDRLMFMLTLKQIQAPSRNAQDAYERLEHALFAAPLRSPRTIILDWLEAELMSLHEAGSDEHNTAMVLLKDAVEFVKVAGSQPAAL